MPLNMITLGTRVFDKKVQHGAARRTKSDIALLNQKLFKVLTNTFLSIYGKYIIIASSVTKKMITY